MGPMNSKVQDGLEKLISGALGEGEIHSDKSPDSVCVSILVGRRVFAEIRVESGSTHVDVHQRLSLACQSVSAHEAELTAFLLRDVGERVKNAESIAVAYMNTQPGARVSSEFAPVEI